MNFDNFKFYMNRIIEAIEQYEVLMDALGTEGIITIGTGLIDSHISLLEYAMNDLSGDWIGYWFYELNQGKDFQVGDITLDDGTQPDISTIEGLYNFLVQHAN